MNKTLEHFIVVNVSDVKGSAPRKVGAEVEPTLRLQWMRDAGHFGRAILGVMAPLREALLRHGFASAGLAGAATNLERFRSGLASLGRGPDQISRIACPSGVPSFGKHAQAIAASVVATLISASADGVIRQAIGERTG